MALHFIDPSSERIKFIGSVPSIKLSGILNDKTIRQFSKIWYFIWILQMSSEGFKLEFWFCGECEDSIKGKISQPWRSIEKERENTNRTANNLI